MNEKTSSLNSNWITDDIIKKNKVDKINNAFMSAERECFISDIKIEKPSSKNYDTFVNNDKGTLKALPQSLIDYETYISIDWKEKENSLFLSLNWDDLQIGKPVEAEYIIADLIKKTSIKETNDWLYCIYLKHTSNILLLCTLLHALSHLDYEQVYPGGPMMALASLSHSDKRVVSFAIKAFSNWNSKASLEFVENFTPQQTWAKDEWNRVINYIQENGDEINGVFDEGNIPGKMDTRSA